jgi:hypothetical protein
VIAGALLALYHHDAKVTREFGGNAGSGDARADDGDVGYDLLSHF